jgi:surface protein
MVLFGRRLMQDKDFHLSARDGDSAEYQCTTNTVLRAVRCCADEVSGLPPSPPPTPTPTPTASPPEAATFTTKASLKAAAQAFNDNQASALLTYGPIANWGVSSITDMSELFKGMGYFNADISGWDTSGVTTMQSMFQVRSARASTLTRIRPARTLLAHCSPHAHESLLLAHNRRPPPLTLGSTRRRSTSR